MVEGRASLDDGELYSEDKNKRIWDEATEYVTTYQGKQKTYYDKKSAKPVEFPIGDLFSGERDC